MSGTSPGGGAGALGGCGGAGAPTARCAKRWFPPATFQMRLRVLREVAFVRGLRQEDLSGGTFHFTLHLSVESEPFYTSSEVRVPAGGDRVLWDRVEVSPEFGGALGCVVKVWRDRNEEDARPVFAASIHLNGLNCIGVHLPPLVTSKPALVLHLAGSYFLASHPGDRGIGGSSGEETIKRHLYFGPFQPNKLLDSYSAPLLCRLQRLHRALANQDAANAHLIEDLERRGLCRDRDRFEALRRPPSSSGEARTGGGSSSSSRSRLLLERAKEPETRMAESELRERLEEARQRVQLRRNERAAAEAGVARKWAAVNAKQREIDEMTTVLMNKLHNFARDKQGLHDWKQRQRIFPIDESSKDSSESSSSGASDEVGAGLASFLSRKVQASQYELLAKLRFIYPIQNPTQIQPTIRWVTMPTLDKARSNTRVEQALSVSLGWVAHALCTSAAVLDVPLRYPVVFRGSQSVVLDPSKGERREQQEFPLYAKGVDVARADYAIFLLNKDLAQVRWQCGLVTTDLKCMLRNLHELLSLGDRQQQQQQQQLQGKISLRSSGPSSRLLSPPPGAEDLSASAAPAPAQKRPQKAPKQQEPAAKDEVKSKNKVSKEPLQEGSSNGGNSSSNNSTWREIDSRTKALSIPTSFQRKKAVGAAAAGGGAGDSKQSTSAARPR